MAVEFGKTGAAQLAVTDDSWLPRCRKVAAGAIEKTQSLCLSLNC
jgi:hypothetical protein